MQCQGNQNLSSRMMRVREFFSVALRTQARAMTRAREILARGLLGGTVWLQRPSWPQRNSASPGSRIRRWL